MDKVSTTCALCANCGYEIDEVNKQTGYCDTCQRAYEKGRASV